MLKMNITYFIEHTILLNYSNFLLFLYCVVSIFKHKFNKIDRSQLPKNINYNKTEIYISKCY